ncbi:MAG: tetratricopeptide repeat protein [Acidobacteriota bacterium]|nr:tetratricopeptide repeat protein [Acidobacteriota bacterium]
MKVNRLVLFLTVLLAAFYAPELRAQRGGQSVIYGDVTVKEDTAPGSKANSYEINLYARASGGAVVARQTVSANGRYRFNNLLDGDYEIVVLFENNEVTRISVQVNAPIYPTDVRQDIALEWKAINSRPAKPASVTAEDSYSRTPPNQKIFDKAQAATDNKKYDESIVFLKQLVTGDPNDFQAWTELGTVFLIEKNLSEAEKAYLKSTEVRPKFFLALMNLGRVRLMQQKYDDAIPILTRAVEVRATSADANYYLGEAYLQIKKGSKAVPYLYEALKLDPVGKAEAHLRLAALYNGAGMKDKAALEYVEFLKKKPDYPDKKKLEQYIEQNKK